MGYYLEERHRGYFECVRGECLGILKGVCDFKSIFLIRLKRAIYFGGGGFKICYLTEKFSIFPFYIYHSNQMISRWVIHRFVGELE